MPEVEAKVSRLEQVLEEFITATRESSQRAEMETIALREDLHNAYLHTDGLTRLSQQRTDEKIMESRLRTDEQIRLSQQRTDDRITRLGEDMRQSQQRTDDRITQLVEDMRQSQQRTDDRITQLGEDMKQSQQRTDDMITRLGEDMRQSQQRTGELITRLDEELKEFKAEGKKMIRQMNKKWGEMANKLGTMVEDLVHPSLPRIIKNKFGLKLQDFYIRRKRTLARDRVKEFDCVGVSEEYVFLNSTKSTLKNKDAEDFLEDIKDFWEFFPEYRDKPLIGILASLHADASVVKYMERKGFMVLCVGDSLMDVKNTKGFKPTVFHYPLNS